MDMFESLEVGDKVTSRATYIVKNLMHLRDQDWVKKEVVVPKQTEQPQPEGEDYEEYGEQAPQEDDRYWEADYTNAKVIKETSLATSP